jgi:proteic killer suppression protein
MDISFKNKRIEKICNNEREMSKHFDKQITKRLQQRLFELRAAGSLDKISHLPPSRLHELDGDREGQLVVDLKHPFRLIFVPDHDPVPRKSDGGIDRTLISAIKIIEVVDYHGK